MSVCRNHRRGLMCTPHNLHTIHFYDPNTDIPLSGFLMSIAADSEKRCEKVSSMEAQHIWWKLCKSYIHSIVKRCWLLFQGIPGHANIGPSDCWYWESDNLILVRLVQESVTCETKIQRIRSVVGVPGGLVRLTIVP